MYLHLEKDEHRWLTELVRSRISEVHPEIRRCRLTSYRQKLREELALLERLLHRLQEAEYDVTA